MIVSIKRLREQENTAPYIRERIERIADLFPHHFQVSPTNIELLVAYNVRADVIIFLYLTWAHWATSGTVPPETLFEEFSSLARQMQRDFEFGQCNKAAIACFCVMEFAEMFDDFMSRIK